ncbi:hypothetical protein MMC07_005573 [Pseudocyphellaria aurata]|nr:hypothetical protein [Pseudocyphellaria aurata]
MRSSAVFIASLSAAIAKPLDYTYPTFEIPPTFQAPSPLNFPEPAGTVGSIGTVGHNGLVAFAETTPPEPNPMNNPIGINYSPGAPAETTQSDTNFINNGIGINYLPQAPSTGDNYIISSAFGGGADQSPDTSAYSTYISQSAAPDRQRQFVDPAPIYWSKRESYQVFLDFDSYDSGTTTFICSEELLGCCGTTYQQAEDQAGIRKSAMNPTGVL